MKLPLLCTVLLASAVAFSLPAAAQTAKPIKLVVPFGPGTSTDIVSRAVGDELGKALGQTVVVENRAGAGGTVATAAVAAAEADGGTLVMGTVGTHAINGALYRKISYNALKDFVPVAYVGATPTLLVVAAASPVLNLRDLRTEMAKAGGATYASAGNGTSGHLAGALTRPMTAQEMAEFGTHETAKWAEAVKSSGAQID